MSKKNLAFVLFFLIKIRFLFGGAEPTVEKYMPVSVVRKEKFFEPDSSRVITRFLFAGEERAKRLIMAVMELQDHRQREILGQVLRKYSKRHRSIQRIFANHFKRLIPILDVMEIDHAHLPEHTRQLIGSYFTMEYSIEAAAFFNPSIIEHPDQSRSEERRVGKERRS